MQRPDFDAWLVYADALQVAGDPRGELISLVHGAAAAARDVYLHEHAETLLAPPRRRFARARIASSGDTA
jgi:uncharacterized protein (TIGR02996 family)